MINDTSAQDSAPALSDKARAFLTDQVRRRVETTLPISIVTVLSGTLLYAEGDKFDAAKLKSYPAGSFVVETPNKPHFMTGKAAVVFQVSVPGKSTFDYVDVKDDPRKK